MPSQFFSPEGNLEDYFITESWLIDQYIGDKLYVWGYNLNGHLGTFDTANKSVPVTTFAGGTNWKQLSSGSFFPNAGIKTDGTLWTWGATTYGTLGNAQSIGNPSTPVTTFAGGTNWKQVSCGYNYAAAIKTDGTLWTWGRANDGRLGTNDETPDRSTPVTTFAGGTDWKLVSNHGDHTVAIKTDGTLWAWGNGINGQIGDANILDRLTPVTTFAGGTDWKQVSGGDGFTFAIKNNGTLWCWGYGFDGTLGNFDTTNKSTPVTTFAGGTNWKYVNAGNSHTAAIKTDGTLWLWGFNGAGRLGTNDTTNRSTPVTTFAGGTNWKSVSVGYRPSAAIKTDGTLWTWGRNQYGELGTNDLIDRSTPVTVFGGLNNWRQVDCGYRHVMAVTTGISPVLPL